ncbi:hypothetical protein ACFE04_006002 [Oxalis oulophora]
MGMRESDPLAQLSLPPGFRFYPTDEELLVQYLCRKVAGHQFSLEIIGEIDLYKFDPWVLPSKAKFGEKEWYFFSPRDRKYPNGCRPNRVAGSGYWKATGTDKIITTEGRKVGIKKALVFYIGKAPKGTKTNWIMHEYRLLDSNRKAGSTKLDEWVLCRIYKKSSSAQKPMLDFSATTSRERTHSNNGESSSSSSHLDDVLEAFTEMDDGMPRVNSIRQNEGKSGNNNINYFHNLGLSGGFDWASLAGLNNSGVSPVPKLAPSEMTQSHTQGMVTNCVGQSSDAYVPTMIGTNSMEQEVESGMKNRNSVGYYQQRQQNFNNSADPFGFRYPNEPSGFGFRQ